MDIISISISFFYLYHFFFLLTSLGLSRDRKIEYSCENRFAILIPAHNEENVIFGSVRSIIKTCLYPRELFDVYVIADNCTDDTISLAKKAGAHVLIRFNERLRGKQHAIKWAFEQINLDDYNAVVILDADNHIHPNYLRVLDAELIKGSKVIQGYIEAKNPCESWVTANYAYMAWYVNRVQMIRSKLGMSAWLGGTGLCIKTEIIKRIGWNVETLVDDAEYTCQLILAGERVVFAPDAVVYDQKPDNLKDSLQQRLRWMRGQTQICIRYLPRLIVSVPYLWFKGNMSQAVRAFDAIMWVPMHLVVLISMIWSVYQGWWQYLLSVFLTVPFFNMLPMVTEKITLWRPWALLGTAGAFFLSWFPVTVWGALTSGNKTWWRTPH